PTRSAWLTLIAGSHSPTTATRWTRRRSRRSLTGISSLRHLRASRKRCPGGAPMQKRVLNDAYIRALKPAAPGTRYAVSDILVPGLRVRVTDQGTKTFIL